MNAHTALCNRILAALSKMGCRVFLNPVGQAVTGKIERINEARSVQLQPGDYVVRFGQRIEYGWCPGSADILGVAPRVITQADVGRTFAVLIGPEVKTGNGRLEPHQRAFRDTMNAMGAYCGEVRSEADAIALAQAAMGIDTGAGGHQGEAGSLLITPAVQALAPESSLG